MARYQIMPHGMVRDTESGAFFPADPTTGNRHSIEYSEWLADGNTPEPMEEEPAIAEVTMRQARLQLLDMGLLAQVDAAFAAMAGEGGERARIEWEYATTVRRDNPTVQALLEELQFDAAQVDQFFTGAAAR